MRLRTGPRAAREPAWERGVQKEATVEMTLKVRDEHEPGDYPCVNIQACDSDTSVGAI